MPTTTKSGNTLLLIYIPCHLDFDLAFENIARIRKQHERDAKGTNASSLQIKIALSVNGTSLTDIEKKKLENSVDYFTYFNENIGGDTNINLGFLKALEVSPTHFWILSANEHLVENAIGNISKFISDFPDSDLFITNSLNRLSTFEVRNFFTGIPTGLSTGLISGVIYNFRTMKSSFSAGPRFSWTGWGQLAVIQYGCQIRGSLLVTELPDSSVYEKPYTFLNGESISSEFEVVRKGYAHSFFGMILLIFALFSRDRKNRNLAIRSWVNNNWFKIAYFKVGTFLKYDKKSPQFDSLWVQELAVGILRNSGFISRILTEIGLFIRTEKWRKSSTLTKVRKSI